MILPSYSAEYRVIKEIAIRIGEAATELFKTSEYHPKVFVVRRQEPNALVLPGGEIFVFSGIFGVSRDPSELAAVIGHEVRCILGKCTQQFRSRIIF